MGLTDASLPTKRNLSSVMGFCPAQFGLDWLKVSGTPHVHVPGLNAASPSTRQNVL